MVISVVLFVLIGTFLFKSANSAAIDYEPIKITVNENFNAQPRQVSQGLESLYPGVVHQGANFYFKPQLTLQGYIPSHTEALKSLIQQHDNSCSKDTSKNVIEKDKLIEILKPLMYLTSDFTKLPPLSSPLPITPELVVIPEAPVLSPLTLNDISSTIEEEVKKEESIILEESTDVFPPIPEISVGPIQEPNIINAEVNPVTSELVVIQEAPVLPRLSFNAILPVVEDEVKKEESIIFEESTDVFSPIPEISVGPIQEPIKINVEPNPITSELVVIPEAPVLPPLSFDGILPVVEDEVKKEESTILEESVDMFPPIPEMSVGPTPEPIMIDVEPKPATTELLIVPETPQLSPLSFDGIPLVLGEEMSLEESIELGDSIDVFPSIPEISARPIAARTVVSESAESFALENNIFPLVSEDVKVEVPIVLEESIQVFPPIWEISSGPILKPIEEHEITDSFVFEETSQPNACTDCVDTVRELNRLGAFSYIPSVSHHSRRVPTIKTKNVMVSKLASLPRLLLKNHPFRLPITPFPKHSRDVMKTSKSGNKNQFVPSSYAHNIVEKRIAPNMVFKSNGPKLAKRFTRSNAPKGPS